MPKVRTQYVCQQCGRVALRDMGRCPQCGSWNSMVEELVAAPAASKGRKAGLAKAVSKPQRITEIGGEFEERLQEEPESAPSEPAEEDASSSDKEWEDEDEVPF